MPEAWSKRKPRLEKVPAIDPYIDVFLRGADDGESFVHQAPRLPVLLQLDGIDAHQFATGTGFVPDSEIEQWRRAVRVPDFYIQRPAGLERSPHCSALVTRDFFRLVNSYDSIKEVLTRVTLGPPLRGESLPTHDSEIGRGAKP